MKSAESELSPCIMSLQTKSSCQIHEQDEFQLCLLVGRQPLKSQHPLPPMDDRPQVRRRRAGHLSTRANSGTKKCTPHLPFPDLKTHINAGILVARKDRRALCCRSCCSTVNSVAMNEPSPTDCFIMGVLEAITVFGLTSQRGKT